MAGLNSILKKAEGIHAQIQNKKARVLDRLAKQIKEESDALVTEYIQKLIRESKQIDADRKRLFRETNAMLREMGFSTQAQ